MLKENVLQKTLRISLGAVVAISVLSGCSGSSQSAANNNTSVETSNENHEKKKAEEEAKARIAAAEARKKKLVEEAKKKAEEEPKLEESKIDTSVFGNADNVKVTDARDITKHIDIVLYHSADANPGVIVQMDINSTYEFLQQEDIKGAETVTIGIMKGDFRITQITVDLKKFKAGEHLVNSVLQASKIDKMNDEVKEYGKIMELW